MALADIPAKLDTLEAQIKTLLANQKSPQDDATIAAVEAKVDALITETAPAPAG